jgi:hypothetical protein
LHRIKLRKLASKFIISGFHRISSNFTIFAILKNQFFRMYSLSESNLNKMYRVLNKFWGISTISGKFERIMTNFDEKFVINSSIRLLWWRTESLPQHSFHACYITLIELSTLYIQWCTTGSLPIEPTLIYRTEKDLASSQTGFLSSIVNPDKPDNPDIGKNELISISAVGRINRLRARLSYVSLRYREGISVKHGQYISNEKILRKNTPVRLLCAERNTVMDPEVPVDKNIPSRVKPGRNNSFRK